MAQGKTCLNNALGNRLVGMKIGSVVYRVLDLLESYCSNDIDGFLTCAYRVLADRESQTRFREFMEKNNVCPCLLDSDILCAIASILYHKYWEKIKKQGSEWDRYIIQKLRDYAINCN
jgi:hypothetical protein